MQDLIGGIARVTSRAPDGADGQLGGGEEEGGGQSQAATEPTPRSRAGRPTPSLTASRRKRDASTVTMKITRATIRTASVSGSPA